MTRARRHAIDADLHDLQAGLFQLLQQFAREEKTVGRQAGGESEFAAVADDLDHVRMQQRLAADESDSHRPEIADFSDPKLEVLELRMRLRVIVFRAVGAIEVALIGQVEAALKRLAVENALAGFEQVVAGKFAADFIEQVHADPKRIGTLRGLAASVIHQ